MLAAMAAVTTAWVSTGCSRVVAQEAAETPARKVELLVYSSDFGMVQETRTVSLEKGVNRLGLTGVSKSLDQGTVLFDWPDRKDAEVRSSTYDLGMSGSDALLQRFLGKEVELVYRGQDGREGERMKGTLELADPGNLVVSVGGKYIVNPDAIIEAPTTEGIVTIPQLTAEVEAQSAGAAKLGLSYLTNGLSWSADYTLTLPAGPSKATSIECWASVLNKTGTEFPDAKIKFVAGSPNRAVDATLSAPMAYGFGGGRGLPETEASGYVARKARTLQALTVGELHAYPYESTATIRQDQVNRVRMMRADDIEVKRWYAIQIPVLWRDGFYGNPEQRLTANLGINFKNDEASRLGKPMPGGAVRVYEPDANGRPQYVGAATISDTPKDARTSLTLSNVFDVYAQAKLLKSEKVGKRKVRKTLEITVRNEKSGTQDVRLVQNFYGTYRIVGETVPSVKLNASQRQWTMSVQAGGEAKLKVTVEF